MDFWKTEVSSFQNWQKSYEKNLNEQEHGQPENEEFERVVSFLLQTFFAFFFNIWVMLLSNNIFPENFFDDILYEKWTKMLILGILFPSFFSDIIFHEIWSIMLEKVSDKFYIVPLFGNKGSKVDEKVLKLGGE